MCIYTIRPSVCCRPTGIEVGISPLDFQHQTDFYDLF
jgi:hypothetical protein